MVCRIAIVSPGANATGTVLTPDTAAPTSDTVSPVATLFFITTQVSVRAAPGPVVTMTERLRATPARVMRVGRRAAESVPDCPREMYRTPAVSTPVCPQSSWMVDEAGVGKSTLLMALSVVQEELDESGDDRPVDYFPCLAERTQLVP